MRIKDFFQRSFSPPLPVANQSLLPQHHSPSPSRIGKPGAYELALQQFASFAEDIGATEVATRAARGEWYGLMYSLPNPDTVLRKAGLANTEYESLLTDSHLYGLIQTRKAGVLSHEWEIAQGASSNSRALREIKAMFGDIDVAKVTKEMLDATLFGYQPLEIVWGKAGSFVVPARIAGKPRDWFTFDMSGNLLFHSRDGGLGRVVRRFDDQTPEPEEPTRKFLLPRNNPSYANAYGDALLSKCYWNVRTKVDGKKWWATFTEKFGMPWVVGKYLRNLEQGQVDAFLSSLVAMVQDAVIVHDEDNEVRVESGHTGASAGTFDLFIQDSRTENAIAVLGHTGSSQSTPGKLGSEDAAMSVASWIVADDRLMVERCWNEVVRWIYELNFSTDGLAPQFRFFQEGDVDQATADRDVKLYSIGWRPTVDYMVKTYGMEESDFTLDHVAAQPAPAVAAAPESATTAEVPEGDSPETAEKGAVFASSGGTQAEPDQELVDRAGNVSGQENAAISKELLHAVTAFVAGEETHEQALDRLASVFSTMSTDQLEEKLIKLQFAADVIGRLGVQDELGLLSKLEKSDAKRT